jgi:hypothetical protein
MGQAVTVDPLQNNRVVHFAHARAFDAGLIRAFPDGESKTAVLGHLGHEWQGVEGAILIQRSQDFSQGANLHLITWSEGEFILLLRHGPDRVSNETAVLRGF